MIITIIIPMKDKSPVILAGHLLKQEKRREIMVTTSILILSMIMIPSKTLRTNSMVTRVGSGDGEGPPIPHI